MSTICYQLWRISFILWSDWTEKITASIGILISSSFCGRHRRHIFLRNWRKLGFSNNWNQGRLKFRTRPSQCARWYNCTSSMKTNELYWFSSIYSMKQIIPKQSFPMEYFLPWYFHQENYGSSWPINVLYHSAMAQLVAYIYNYFGCLLNLFPRFPEDWYGFFCIYVEDKAWDGFYHILFTKDITAFHNNICEILVELHGIITPFHIALQLFSFVLYARVDDVWFFVRSKLFVLLP